MPATWSGPRKRRVPHATASSSCWPETHLHGNTELFDVLVRDHLADHPKHLGWPPGSPAGITNGSRGEEHGSDHCHPHATSTVQHDRSAPSLAGWHRPRGFPLGGGTAWLLTGPVDSPASALAGGLITGLVLGVVQAWAMRAGPPAHGPRGPSRPRSAWPSDWTIGATLVGYSTGARATWPFKVRSPVRRSAVAQAVALWCPPGADRARLARGTWPLAWTIGWIVRHLDRHQGRRTVRRVRRRPVQ